MKPGVKYPDVSLQEAVDVMVADMRSVGAFDTVTILDRLGCDEFYSDRSHWTIFVQGSSGGSWMVVVEAPDMLQRGTDDHVSEARAMAAGRREFINWIEGDAWEIAQRDGVPFKPRVFRPY